MSIRSHTYKCPFWRSGGYCTHKNRFVEFFRPREAIPCPLKLGARTPNITIRAPRPTLKTEPPHSFLTSDPIKVLQLLSPTLPKG